MRGFGRLSGRWSFARGLTVVCGGNEAGKSTLHDALVRALFGFSRAERRRSDGVSLKDTRRPWAGGEFALTAVVRDADGRAYRVDWDFERHEVEVRDHETGADLTREVRGADDEAAPGEFFLGLPREQFLAVDELSVNEDGSLLIRERVEGGRHQISRCAGPPAMLAWATGTLPEPPNHPQTGMANMRVILPVLQKATSVQLVQTAEYVRAALPAAVRQTRVVKDMPAAEIARELVEWIRQ